MDGVYHDNMAVELVQAGLFHVDNKTQLYIKPEPGGLTSS
jgi:hypothetical protein